jgi:ribosome biogenesis GTPase
MVAKRSRRPPAKDGSGASANGSDSKLGVIVAHFGIALALRLDDGTRQRVRVRRNSSHIVGDRVRLEAGQIVSLPDRGVLRRRDTHGRIRSVASNLDLLGIVVSPRPASPTGFVDRAIVGARAAGIEPVIVVNKCDLVGARPLFDELGEGYSSIALRVLVSAVSGEGLEGLRAVLAVGMRAAFVGTSGVGKSSLLNALCPELDLDVGEINELSGLGRHVTSNATLHQLPGGGELIDTPGFRDFGPVEVSARELAAHFPGFEASLSERCRFRDCLHRSEPGCVVRGAVLEERIAEARHTAYLDLLSDLEAAEERERGY